MEKKYSLPYKAEIGIVKLAEKCGIDKVILFGSRARGDNSRTSDIDIAVSGGQVYRFKCSVDDEVETLLMFRLSLSVRPFSRLVFESPGFCGGGG